MPLVYTCSLAILVTSAAFAAPSGRDAIAAAVQRQLVAPFAEWQATRGEFSRAEMPPSEMRVRVLGAPVKDRDGAEFVAFAVDSRNADGDWLPSRMKGCVYADTSAVYVQRGGTFLAAADYFAAAAVPHPAVCIPGSR
jgi:hypothetical protein